MDKSESEREGFTSASESDAEQARRDFFTNAAHERLEKTRKKILSKTRKDLPKKRHAWGYDFQLLILQRIDHEGVKASVLTKRYGIPKSTISTWRTRHADVMKRIAEGRTVHKTKRARLSKWPKLDEALLVWFMDIKAKPGGDKARISGEMMVEKAKQ